MRLSQLLVQLHQQQIQDALAANIYIEQPDGTLTPARLNRARTKEGRITITPDTPPHLKSVPAD